MTNTVFNCVALPLLLLLRTTAEPDYYETLGLQEARDDASDRDIKTAWRRLSKQYHPDLVGEQSRSQYQSIQRAYEVLGDKRKRKVYDLRGDAGLAQLEGTARNHHHNPLEAIFGGGSDATKTPNKNFIVVVSLEDMYNGAEHTVRYAQKKTCRKCRGTGAEPGTSYIRCPSCGGQGHVRKNIEVFPGLQMLQDVPCPVCKGEGKQAATKCQTCHGFILTKGKHNLTFVVDIGVPNYHSIPFEMEADHGLTGIPGDVVLTLVAAPHPLFERRGDNLYMNYTISLREALVGFHHVLLHLDGHGVDVEEMGVTQPGYVSIVRGEGMPVFNVPSEKGNLSVKYNIELPKSLTAEQQRAIEQAF